MKSQKTISLNKLFFGLLLNDKNIDVFIIRNSSGMGLSISNYCGRIKSLSVPDKHGKSNNIVLGYDSLGDYLNDELYNCR